MKVNHLFNFVDNTHKNFNTMTNSNDFVNMALYNMMWVVKTNIKIDKLQLKQIHANGFSGC